MQVYSISTLPTRTLQRPVISKTVIQPDIRPQFGAWKDRPQFKWVIGGSLLGVALIGAVLKGPDWLKQMGVRQPDIVKSDASSEKAVIQADNKFRATELEFTHVVDDFVQAILPSLDVFKHATDGQKTLLKTAAQKMQETRKNLQAEKVTPAGILALGDKHPAVNQVDAYRHYTQATGEAFKKFIDILLQEEPEDLPESVKKIMDGFERKGEPLQKNSINDLLAYRLAHKAAGGTYKSPWGDL